MMRLKFAKALVLGVCLTVFSSTAAFAQSGETKPGAVMAQPGGKVQPGVKLQPDAQVQPEEGVMTIMGGSEGSGVSGTAGEVQPVEPVSEEILKKQDEINQYLFEQYKDEISQMGFTVTHTVPFDKVVEIGITPFNEKNAEYLYNLFGRDKVKVVEGVQAATMELQNTASDAVGGIATDSVGRGDVVTLPAENERDQIYTTNVVSAQVGAPEKASGIAATAATSVNSVSPSMIAVFIAAAAVLSAFAAFLTRRFRTSKS